MTTLDQVNVFLEGLSDPIQSQTQLLHEAFGQLDSRKELWFDRGINEEGKITNNPTIGYGMQTLVYGNGKTKPFFRIGLCPTATGISVYILGLKNKAYLTNAYGSRLGKAKVTSYCIKFKHINDIALPVLLEAVQFGLESV